MSDRAFFWHLVLVFPYVIATSFLAIQHLAEHWH